MGCILANSPHGVTAICSKSLCNLGRGLPQELALLEGQRSFPEERKGIERGSVHNTWT